MKTNEKKIIAKQDLQPKEWIFAKDGECPENQIEFCYFYEFAREAWRAGYGGNRDPLYRYDSFMRHFPQWRTVPYLAVLTEHREKALAAYRKELAAHDEWMQTKFPTPNPAAPVDELRDKHGYQDTVTRASWGFKHFNPLIKGEDQDNATCPPGMPIEKTTWFVHKIEWCKEDDYLKKEFDQWLIDHRPKDVQPIGGVDTRRDTTTEERLKRLAVLRLHRAYGYKGAKEAIKAATKDGESVWNPYTAHESWCRAARQAQNDLEEFIYENCETDTSRFTSKGLAECDVEKAVAEYLKTHR